MKDLARDAVVVVAEDAEAVARESAERFVRVVVDCLGNQAVCNIALSGGTTPRLMYEMLASPGLCEQVDWSRLQMFFSDERFVPWDSDDSNFGLAQRTLLAAVPLPADHVHPYETAGVTPQESAERYESLVRDVVGADVSGVPVFDLIMLGLGSDGHTASLFPGTGALDVEDKLIVSNFVAAKDSWRLTFTLRVINSARNVMIVAQGAEKTGAVTAVLVDGEGLPAARVEPAGSLAWILDKVAAAGLSMPQRAQTT